MKPENITIRKAECADCHVLKSLAARCMPLTPYQSFVYAFVMLLFPGYILLAEQGGAPVGFISTLPLMLRKNLGLFVWQLGVLETHRGQGISHSLIHAAVSGRTDIKRLVVGIDPKNASSMGSFLKTARLFGARLKEWRRPHLVSGTAFLLRYFRERVLYVRFARKPVMSF